MKRMNPSTRARSQSGTSLIEVLVAVIIMSIGLLGVAAMQSITLRNSQGAMERTQGVVQTYSILDAMRANVTAARAGAYNVAIATPCAVPAAGTSLVQNDLRDWILSLQATLGPSACGGVSCTANVCTVTVRWDDSRASGGVDNQQIQTTSRL